MSDEIKTPAGKIAKFAKEAVDRIPDQIKDEVTKAVSQIELPEGEKGKDGETGIGFNAKAWEERIYREGEVVQHNFGQCFKAVRDTNSDPNSYDGNWARLGSAGLRWTGLKQKDFDYQDGDLFIDGGSCFIVKGGKPSMFVQRGKNGKDGLDGIDGKDGKNAAHLIEMYLDEKGFYGIMSDGSTVQGDQNISKVIEEQAAQKALLWLEQQWEQEEKIGIRFKLFRGNYKRGESYSKGDCVNFNSSLYIANDSDNNSRSLDGEKWIKIAGKGGGGGGGGGGAGGGAFLGTLWNQGRAMDMATQIITNLGAPRSGTIGDSDATTKKYVDAAIAAGALYQGIYTVEKNNPDLASKADSGFTAPTASSTVAKPNAAASDVSNPLNILTWHNWGGNGFDTFAATTVAPTAFEVRLSDGTISKFVIPAGTYADEAALKAELDSHAAAAGVVSFEVYVNGADCHIGVETVAPLYCTAIGNETGSAFPAAVPGAGNSILNTYNWVVQTKDENTPEALPPGLPGLAAGTVVKNSDVLQWSSTINGFEVISGSSLTQSFSDQRYWQINQGNMAWVDQAYNKGVIVYGSKVNAWFVSTQNITAGSPEPGTQAAGAIWRKINSTYGSTVFFGKGDYDPSDTTSNNNWGMPAGTYPAGQQPLNGDSYFDVLTGSTSDFSVTEQPSVYTISGSLGTKQLDVAGASILNGWPNTFVGTAAGDHWDVAALPTPFTFTGGVFNGEAIPANTVSHIVWSGDPDADHNGWVLVLAPVTTWTVTTPHPQKVPDVIAATTQYGFTRKFSITIPAGAADDEVYSLVKGFAGNTQISRVEIKDTSASGSAYEFDLMISAGVGLVVSPIAAIAHNPTLKEIGATWSGSGQIFAVVKASAAGKTYEVIVTSQDQDLNDLSIGGVIIAKGAEQTLNAEKNYPDTAELEKELIASSASADIQRETLLSRSSVTTGVDQSAFTLGVSPARKIRTTFTVRMNSNPSGAERPCLITQRAGSWVNWASDLVESQFWMVNGNHAYSSDSAEFATSGGQLGLYLLPPNVRLHGANTHYITAEMTIYGTAGMTLEWTLNGYMTFTPPQGDSNNNRVDLKGIAHYSGDWSKINNIGVKNVGITFEWIRAHIEWY